MSIFDESIETDLGGMAGGTGYCDFEEIYQAFKERLINELRVTTPMNELPKLIDTTTNNEVN